MFFPQPPPHNALSYIKGSPLKSLVPLRAGLFNMDKQYDILIIQILKSLHAAYSSIAQEVLDFFLHFSDFGGVSVSVFFPTSCTHGYRIVYILYP